MTSRSCSLATVPLRVMLGLGMVYHGYPKVFAADQHAQFAGTLGGMGVPVPEQMAWFLGGLELFGGGLIVLGAMTRLLSALFVVEMLVAIATVHWVNGFPAGSVVGVGEDGPIWGAPGWEVNALYIAGFLALMIAGAGRYSVDGLVTRRVHVGTQEFEAGAPPPRSTPRRRVSPWRRRSTDVAQPASKAPRKSELN